MINVFKNYMIPHKTIHHGLSLLQKNSVQCNRILLESKKDQLSFIQDGRKRAEREGRNAVEEEERKEPQEWGSSSERQSLSLLLSPSRAHQDHSQNLTPTGRG